MLSKRDPRDWSLSPELQAKFDQIVEHTRRLQKELVIQPMTIAERAKAYELRKQQEEQLKSVLGNRRPPPKWKV